MSDKNEISLPKISNPVSVQKLIATAVCASKKMREMSKTVPTIIVKKTTIKMVPIVEIIAPNHNKRATKPITDKI